MLKWSNTLFLLLSATLALGQTADSCSVRVAGAVVSAQSGKPIPFAHVQTPDTAVICGQEGTFAFWHSCSFPLVISANAYGFEAATDTLQHPIDQPLLLPLIYSSGNAIQTLIASEVRVKGNYGAAEQALALHQASNMELSQAISALPGVRVLNSANVSKPVIHGLLGSRIPIVVDGIELGSQTWGLDHAPELDASRAGLVRVLHGARSVWHAGAAGGSVLQVQSTKPDSTGQFKGHVRQAVHSNGRSSYTSMRATKGTQGFAWQVQGAYQNSGDLKTSSYFLRNTGLDTRSLSATFKGNVSDRFQWQTALAGYQSQRGILRGSHIGNLTDLEDALQREVPFFTEDTFSRFQESPRQEVLHLTSQSHLTYVAAESSHRVLFGLQKDSRQEHDVRRGSLTDTPSLDLDLTTSDFRLENRWKWLQLAWSYRVNENRNQPGTQVRPLIPDYVERNARLAGIWTPPLGQNNWTLGWQFGYSKVLTWPLSQGLNPFFVRTERERFLARLAADYSYDHNTLHASFSAILEHREPTVQEWYSNGLHQGISAIEEGNPDLQAEQTAKTTFSFNWKGERIQVQTQAYAQVTQGYIQLLPTGENRLTTRGAFPVYAYTSQDALLAGVDASIRSWALMDWKPWLGPLTTGVRWSHGQSWEGASLNLIPPPEAFVQFDKWIYRSISPAGRAHQLNIAVWHISTTFRRVGQQLHFPEELAFAPPPEGAWLWDAAVSYSPLKAGKPSGWTIKCEVKNALNVAYRDYLNQMRFFADNLGRDVRLSAYFRF